jgi:hypothetical protein
MRVKRKCNHFKCNQGFSSKAACHEKKKLTCHQGIIKLVNSLLSCLSCQNHFMFLNRGSHVDITDSLAEDEGELFFLFDTSSLKVFREENHPFRRNAWTFMKFIPGLHTTWHMCVFHDQYTLTNDVLQITLCVDIISFLLEFSFEFI